MIENSESLQPVSVSGKVLTDAQISKLHNGVQSDKIFYTAVSLFSNVFITAANSIQKPTAFDLIEPATPISTHGLVLISAWLGVND